MPFSRRRTIAASMSPFVSWSARFESIIPAPVRSRSSLTRVAAISAIRRLLRRHGRRIRLRSALGLRILTGRHRDGLALAFGIGLHLNAGLCDLDLRRGLRLGGRSTAVLLLREVARGHLLLALV